MEFVSNGPKGREQPTLNFIFNTWGIGPYGEKESQWEATVHYPDHNITDYGYTLEQAAERLLELLLHRSIAINFIVSLIYFGMIFQ